MGSTRFYTGMTGRTVLLLLILEGLAIVGTAYIWSFLQYRELRHVILSLLVFCLWGPIAYLALELLARLPGWQKRARLLTLLVGALMLALGIWLRLGAHDHERAALPFGLGVLTCVVGVENWLAARSLEATFGGLLALGMLLLGGGVLFLETFATPGRAVGLMGLGLLALFGGGYGLWSVRRQDSRKHLAKVSGQEERA